MENKKCSRATTYEKAHPSWLALCFVRKEHEFLMSNFCDDLVQALCVEECLGDGLFINNPMKKKHSHKQEEDEEEEEMSRTRRNAIAVW